MARVFVSFASPDHEWAARLHDWLVADGHEVFLDRDLQDGIAVGEVWKQRLYERLRWADALVCVMTAAYRRSTWCAAEITAAQLRGSRLLPVLVEPDATHPLLAAEDCQRADLTQDLEAGRARLGEALRRLDTAGGRGWPDERSPFPGLRPFDLELHRVFFGRHTETEELAARLRSPTGGEESGLLLVVGPSGCGKSSLVRAGLVPVMAAEPGWWTLPPLVPGPDPVAALAAELAHAARDLGLTWPLQQVRDRLQDPDGLAVLAEELLLATPGPGRRRRLLLVVDQLEELLIQTPAAQRARFAALLEPALAGPLRVMATLRPEFLGQLTSSEELAGLPARPFILRPLRREALASVIQGPAELAGIGVEPELVTRLVADTDTGEALPLLAFTLAQLAEGVGRGGHLSMARYEQVGGVHGALTRQADAALDAALAATGRTREEVIAGLLRLVTVDEQGHPVRWRVPRAELPDPVRTELDAFITRRLLTTDTTEPDSGTGNGKNPGDQVVISVAHEAFLSAWPPLASAVAAAATGLRARRVVEQAAQEWEQAGRVPDRLWERGQLAAAVADTGAHFTGPWYTRLLPGRNWNLVTDAVEITSRGRDFLQRSIRRDRLRRQRATTVLSALLLLAVIATGWAVLQQRAAREQQRIATARQLISQAEAARDTDPRTALRLGVAAHAVHADNQTQASLVNTLTATHYAGTMTLADAVDDVAFAPDGKTLATASPDNSVVLWDLTDRAHPTRLGPPLTGHTDAVNAMAFAPDGKTLATASLDKTVILWDLTDRAHPTRLGLPLAHADQVNDVAFAPDGKTLAAAGYDKTAILWDLTDRAHPTRLGPPLTLADAVDAVAFAPDGKTLATAGSDKTVTLWDATNRAHPTRLGPPLTGHTDSVVSVAFAPDGRTLATASPDTTVILWDLTDRAHPARLGPPLAGHTDSVVSVAFAPDGRTLATASRDKTAIVWDLTNRAHPARLGPPLAGHTGPVLSVAFAPDGRTLATASRDTTVILWDLTDRAHPTRLGLPLAHADQVNAVAFAPDGRTLATASYDDTVILWDLTDRTHPSRLGAPLTDHTDRVWSVAFAPDGKTLATASGDTTVILWDLTDRTHPTRLGPPLTGHTAPVFVAAFAPDGRTLATASYDDTVILWDLTDRAHPARLGAPLTLADAVYAAAFAPDDRTLATANDTTVILWDLTDRAHPTRLGAPLTGHTGTVDRVAFAPHGNILATASGDTTVILWDLTDRTHPTRLGAPLTLADAVYAAAFAPDGRTLATTNGDNTAVLWDLTSLIDLREHTTQHACALTSGGLDQEEWHRYISGLPYRETCP